MRRQLSAGPVFGTLPLIYVFLARAGKTIGEAETIVLDQEGNVRQADAERKGAETGEGSHGARGIRIVFSDKNHSQPFIILVEMFPMMAWARAGCSNSAANLAKPMPLSRAHRISCIVIDMPICAILF